MEDFDLVCQDCGTGEENEITVCGKCLHERAMDV